ncbi:hypothetical protein A2999_01080 [Candidatus Wolfebacteria bacterium RIFCSPLOWO2_01_FULL_38_11]|uniref:Uncharacterized protein n=2 Tax=Candidatus Wolfeibacteriota TaxID=1752735 RepID=A0A0G0IEQ1_9BACT|nr:MAG: hypothetical protein US36_C0007G0012 [Candidatus Wolfebacteria bacterium GW2011_GWC1_37_10]OGM91114.1 MAG: hypothetical protein A2999_01080 [Candidatus Wolfebacteria bacterium RIFCSPLOWO2_01_FULL_38_11]
MGNNSKNGFTLLELLIVIGILAILSTTVILVINPLELLDQTRDSKRITELKNINSALNLYLLDGGSSFGATSTVYASLPDNSANCSSYVLPNLPSGWSYSCKNQQNYKKVDGNGWIPIDLSSIFSGSPLSILPTDPVNDQNYYYTFVTGNSWELTARLKSALYGFGGGMDHVVSDGGDDFTRYEQGTNLQSNPHSFEFAAFTTSTDNSQKPGWYHFFGAGTVSALVDVGDSNFLRADGFVWYIWQENIPYDPNVLYETKCRVKQVVDNLTPKEIYCGWVGVAADGTTLVNSSGANAYTGQHHHVAFAQTLAAGPLPVYTTFIGYTKGHGSPNGTLIACPDPNSPCSMHANVKFIRPFFILNFNGGTGIADIDFITSQRR